MRPQNVEIPSKIRSLARFHFVAGLPRSGLSVLSALLNQNPRFTIGLHGPAHAVFRQSTKCYAAPEIAPDLLDEAQKTALLRSSIDAVYHDRPFDSVVFDINRNWLDEVDTLVRLYPLSRFIICVRNPSAIVNSQTFSGSEARDDEALARTANALVAPDGEIGVEIARLRAALSSRHGERMFVLDYDRLADDPEEVMDALYDFLREPEFVHEYNEVRVGDAYGSIRHSDKPMILPTRMILQLSGRAFWRNLKRTSATLMLGRAR